MPKVMYTLRAHIKSFTDPNKTYAIKKKQDGTFTCGCPSWRFNQSGDRNCKHLRAIFESGDNLEKLFMHGNSHVLEIDGEKWEVVKEQEVQ
jgi:hypothetical protein